MTPEGNTISMSSGRSRVISFLKDSEVPFILIDFVKTFSIG